MVEPSSHNGANDQDSPSAAPRFGLHYCVLDVLDVVILYWPVLSGSASCGFDLYGGFVMLCAMLSVTFECCKACVDVLQRCGERTRD